MSLRLSDTATVGASLSSSFPMLQMACAHIFFIFFLKSSCGSLCLSLASWNELCDREEEPPGPRGCSWWGGWELAGMSAVGQELCVLSCFPPLLPASGCFWNQQDWTFCSAGERWGEGAQCSTPRVSPRYSPSLPVASPKDAPGDTEDGQAAVVTQTLPYKYIGSSLYNSHVKLP